MAWSKMQNPETVGQKSYQEMNKQLVIPRALMFADKNLCFFGSAGHHSDDEEPAEQIHPADAAWELNAT